MRTACPRRSARAVLLPAAVLAALFALAGCNESTPAEPTANSTPTTPAEPVLPPEPPSTSASADPWTADRIRTPNGAIWIRAEGTATVGITQAEMDWVTAGYGWPASEQPATRTVTLPPFYIAETEFSNEQFAQFLTANPDYQTTRSADPKFLGLWKLPRDPNQPAAVPSPLPEGQLHQPVVYITRADAEACAAWLTASEQAAHRLPAGWVYRLPTEEEWELAARGADGTAATQQTAAATTAPRSRFPWGAEFKAENAWFGESIAGEKLDAARYFSWARGYRAKHSVDGIVVPQLVDVKAARYYAGRSPIGCYHMAGNVWEWTMGSTGDKAAVKGGGWWSPAPELLVAKRLLTDPNKPMPDIGFRLIVAPQ